MNLGLFRQTLLAVCALCIVLLWSGLLQAQTPPGSLLGQVTDPSGASVSGATVQLTTPSGASMDTTTNKEGFYEFKELLPGKYTVNGVAQGFALFTREGVDIVSGQTAKLNIQLTIEAQEEKVLVNDTSTQLDMNPANNANTIVLKGKDLEALSDDPDELESELQALAGPAAGPNGGQIYIDGFTAGQLPAKASIREIRINQNPFSAEYDRLGYGHIEIFTKPGTDQFHGQIFASGNSSAFNARNPFEHLPAGTQPPGYESTQFSANIGGPLSKKASFFFNIERRDINNLNIVSAQVLDPNANYNVVSFSPAVANPSTRTNLSPRLDYQVSANNSLTVRYQYFRENEDNNGVGGFNLASQGINSHGREHQLQITDTQTLSPKTINETRFQYVHENNGQSPESNDPTLSVQGAFNGGGNSGGVNNDTQDRFELQNNTYMNFGKHFLKFGGRLRATKDRSEANPNFNGTFSFGSRQILDQNCVVTPQNNCLITISGLLAYQTTVRLLAQNPSGPFSQIIAQGGGATNYEITMGNARAEVTYVDAGLYAQDDWRIKPNVTLSYGLRFETQNNLPDHADLAPRVGLAWGIDGNPKNPPKTVIRAGFGIFYDRFTYGLYLQQQRLNGITQQQTIISSPNFFFTTNPPPIPLSSGTPSAAPTIYQPNPNLRAPYTIQTGVSLERQLTKSANIAVTYLNSRGLHTFYTDNINAPDLVTGVRLQPNEGNIFQYQSAGIFKQNQLIVNSSVRLGTKLSLFGYYTLNYVDSDASGAGSFPTTPLHVSQDYGRAAFDIRHRLFMAGTIGLPYAFRLSPFLVASSGIPFNITTGADPYQDFVYQARPALVTCPTTPTAGIVQTKYGCFDPAPLPGTPVIPINYAEGPGRFSLNLRLSKTFGFGRKIEGTGGAPAGPRGAGTFGRGPGGGGRGGPGGGRGMDSGATNQRYGLTFSVSARNIFNDVNLAPPIGNLSSPLFGQSNGLAGRPYSDSTSNRRIDLQVTFTF